MAMDRPTTLLKPATQVNKASAKLKPRPVQLSKEIEHENRDAGTEQALVPTK